MKSSIAVLAVALILVSAALAIPNHKSEASHSNCLSQEDVNWFTDRSKSGIARTCDNSVLQQNIDRLNQQ